MNSTREELVSDTRRKALDYWTREDNYRVKVETRHDTGRKAYVTTISECLVLPRDGYSVERHAVFADLYKVLNVEKVARYNFKNMTALHRDIVAATIKDVEQLLREHAVIEGGEE